MAVDEDCGSVEAGGVHILKRIVTVFLSMLDDAGEVIVRNQGADAERWRRKEKETGS